jgi:hypothetical protein
MRPLKLLYKTKPLKFPTPADLKKAMDDYFKELEEENKSNEYLQCSNCMKKFTKDEEPICCEDQHIVHIYDEVKPEDKLRPSLYGFCAWAGIHRQTLFDYKHREGYEEVYEWFLSILQMDLEQILLNPGTRNIGGAKFVAVNNYGWKDKTETEHVGSQPVTFINNLPITPDDEGEE